MHLICKPSILQGRVPIPGSKSHTIRGLAVAAMASGPSVLEKPLHAGDTRSALQAVAALGAEFTEQADHWVITGCGGQPRRRAEVIDVGNSGTSLNIFMSLAALLPRSEAVTFTGDEQIRRRPSGPLIRSLRDLGAEAGSHYGNDCAPLTVGGRLKGGRTRLEARNSQYLTSLLLACPLAEEDSEIEVPVLHEAAYVRMTLDWLRRQHIMVEYTPRLDRFQVSGRNCYQPFRRRIPADFSSAAFFLAAGALPGNMTICEGLDINDTQGDKAVLDYLRALGARVTVADSGITVAADTLRGLEIDLNDTPDALPAMAVIACFAAGETRLVNVPQARIKETDRIAVMAAELSKMGADIQERQDGLIIRESRLSGAAVEGHGDHRVVMALALAGLGSSGITRISGAEAASVTCPEFPALMRSLGAELEEET